MLEQPFTTVLVIGAGDMGHGIAETCAISGFKVIIKDVSPKLLDLCKQRMKESLDILERKHQRPAGSSDDILARVSFSHDTEQVKAMLSGNTGPCIAIEAVPESMALKHKVFSEIAPLLPVGSIIASNTSNLSITKMATAINDQETVVGLHFFNPVVLMDTVEVIKGEKTSDETLSRARAFVESLGKIAVPVLRDRPGFVVNRVQAPTQLLINSIVDAGLATPAQVDAMARSFGLPMGPFETYDYVGLDVVVHGLEYFAETLDPAFAPPRFLKDLHDDGNLGKKTGRGIFNWSRGRPDVSGDSPTTAITMKDLIYVQLNEAMRVAKEGIVERLEDIDIAIINGTGNKNGVLGVLQGDRNAIVLRLEELACNTGVGYFHPEPTIISVAMPNTSKAMYEIKKRLRKMRKKDARNE